jgi:peptidoglycan/xylan/chitin deacetylase (PgdA/CDA1 family)
MQALLKAFKLPAPNPQLFFEQLAETTGVDPVVFVKTPLFMSWDNALEMLNGGMDIGSHSHTHPLLAALSGDELMAELTDSRRVLRARLGIDAAALAYPVGIKSAFNGETKRAVAAAGYRAAFSYYGGINLPGSIDRYELKRIPVERDHSAEMVRLRVGTAIATGRDRM